MVFSSQEILTDITRRAFRMRRLCFLSNLCTAYEVHNADSAITFKISCDDCEVPATNNFYECQHVSDTVATTVTIVTAAVHSVHTVFSCL